MTRSSCYGLTPPNSGTASFADLLVRKLSLYRAVVVASLLVVAASTPAAARADSPDDFVIPNGHFYTQTNGFPPNTSSRGYAVTDEDDVPFWSEFKSLGGVGVIGYPISQRFTDGGKVIQLTQRAVFVYDPEKKRVQLLDALDILSRAGRDGWLKEHQHIPPPVRKASINSDSGTQKESLELLRLLDQSPEIKKYYESDPKVSALLGLPTSDLYHVNELTVMRFQRGALQLWKVDTAWANAGDVSLANTGEVIRESGVFPADPMAPEEPPQAVTARLSASSRGQDVRRGLATWYGWDFHGLEMRNGEIYNMYDATTTACNIHPLGTWLRVTSVSTGRNVDVRITDTGAFRYPIIVDLSWAAFKKLADPNEGIVEVTVEPIDKR